jgi:hypothetical protein
LRNVENEKGNEKTKQKKKKKKKQNEKWRKGRRRSRRDTKKKKEEKKQHFNDVVMVNCGARVYRKPRRAGDRGSRCTNSTTIKRSPK